MKAEASCTNALNAFEKPYGTVIGHGTERPHLDLKESRTAVSRTAEELRLEYNHAVKELEGQGKSPQKRSTSRKCPWHSERFSRHLHPAITTRVKSND